MSIDLTSLSPRELSSLIKTAQKRQATIAKRVPIAKIRAKITKMAKAEGYSIEELFGAEVPARGRRAATKAAKPARKLGKVAPKYRNPANPKETWTGRGKHPRWLAEKLTAGKKVTDFLIKK
nr:H-NS histone family protein [Xanthomonas massiliensis]